MSDGHAKQADSGEFCAKRKDSCCGGNNYRACCKKWEGAAFAQYRFKEGNSAPRNFEAHHLLCVASVTEHLIGGDSGDSSILDIVQQTKWCINKESNMIALPLWGHTVKYYCDLETGGLTVAARILGQEIDVPPPFEDHPQHDYDHNSKKGYKKNHVDKAMIKVAQRIEKQKDAHKAAVEDLKAVLDNLSDTFRQMLQTLGKQSGGTHDAWKNAPDDPKGDWYLPFSMALARNAEKRVFPIAGGKGKAKKLYEKINRLAEAFQSWGAT